MGEVDTKAGADGVSLPRGSEGADGQAGGAAGRLAQAVRSAQAAQSAHSARSARQPVITFVVPCFNSAAYMGRCLASIVDVVEEGAAEAPGPEEGAAEGVVAEAGAPKAVAAEQPAPPDSSGMSAGRAAPPAGPGMSAGRPAPPAAPAAPTGQAPPAASPAPTCDVEVIVVDDGSSDEGATLACAREWEARHPGLVRAVHQENGGPGEAINTGLAQARGAYFKVVDSDDWLDADALRRVLAQLRTLWAGARQADESAMVDMLVCNYVYEYADGSPARPVRYTREFPQGRPFTWDEMLRPFPMWRYMMMHAAIFRTGLLRDMGLRLPARTFYVDEIMIYAPLPRVRTLMYLDADLYRYLIGRADQSVNEQVMASRCDQQVRVGRIKIDAVDVRAVPSAALRRYLVHDLTITMCFCTVFTTLSGRPDRFALRDGIWDYLRERDRRLWWRIRWSFIGWWCNLRSPLGVRAFEWGYRTVRDAFRFN